MPKLSTVPSDIEFKKYAQKCRCTEEKCGESFTFPARATAASGTFPYKILQTSSGFDSPNAVSGINWEHAALWIPLLEKKEEGVLLLGQEGIWRVNAPTEPVNGNSDAFKFSLDGSEIYSGDPSMKLRLITFWDPPKGMTSCCGTGFGIMARSISSNNISISFGHKINEKRKQALASQIFEIRKSIKISEEKAFTNIEAGLLPKLEGLLIGHNVTIRSWIFRTSNSGKEITKRFFELQGLDEPLITYLPKRLQEKDRKS